ncbi:hypothetical protein QTP88_019554 [Uroleucon formosanum]
MRALVDSASQISAVTAACVKRLGLKMSRWTAPISGLSGTTVAKVQGQVECIVRPRFASDPILPVQAWVLPTITTDLPQKSLSIDIKNRYSNLVLADPSFHTTSPIDLLLGGDVYGSIMDGRKVSIDSTLPTAFSSVFGWILIGPVPDRTNCNYQSLPVSMTASIEGIMERFWHVEEPEDAPVTFTEEGCCEQIFRDEATRLTSGRFAVPLSFRARTETLSFGLPATISKQTQKATVNGPPVSRVKMTEGHCKPNMNFDNSSIVTASGDSDPQMPATGSEQAGSQGSSSNDRRGMGVASQAPITSHATSAETTRSVVKVTRETAEGVSGTPTEKTVQRGLVANQGTVANRLAASTSAKMCREEIEECFLKTTEATMVGLGKLEEAITGAPNTKKDVKDSAKTLGSNLRLMHRYLTDLFKGSATRDRVPPAQQ